MCSNVNETLRQQICDARVTSEDVHLMNEKSKGRRSVQFIGQRSTMDSVCDCPLLFRLGNCSNCIIFSSFLSYLFFLHTHPQSSNNQCIQ